MDTATELTMWHVQCIHFPLQTPQDISDYIDDTNNLIRRIWEKPGEAASTPPQLQVDAVENSAVAHRGDSVNTVRLRFKLPPKHQKDNDAFLGAIRHFCERIFELKTRGNLYSLISRMSRLGLIGVIPLSQWFKFYWTQGFLETFVRQRVSLFNELADAEFLSSWLGGTVYIVLAASDQKTSDILRGMRVALANNFDFEARRPPQDVENRSKQLSKEFIRGVQRVQIHLDSTTDVCTRLIAEGTTQLPSDLEIQLFNAVFELFQAGFEVLTANKEVFDEWQKIVSSTAGKVHTACFTTAASLGLFGVSAVAASAGTIGTAGAVGVVLGPFAMLVVSSVMLFLHNSNHNKAKEERDEIKKVSEGIRGHHDIVRHLAQWFVSGHTPAQEYEGREMQDMRAKLDERGLAPIFSLRDYKAVISSEAEAIRQQLQKMEADPELKEYFS